jgi:hypothetical protein
LHKAIALPVTRAIMYPCTEGISPRADEDRDMANIDAATKAKYAAVVVDRMNGDIVSKHKSYNAANKAATKRGDRYAVESWRAYA